MTGLHRASADPAPSGGKDVRYHRFLVGLDLGQAQDFTALAILEQVVTKTWPDYIALTEYHLRYLKRYQLGTTYPKVVQSVCRIMNRPELRLTGYKEPALIVDQTGVGRPVVDLMRANGLQPYGVTITSGRDVRANGPMQWTVPKREIAATLQVLLQEGQLKFADGLPDLDTLKRELTSFKVKISTSGRDTYEAWREGDHDDMVLGVGLAAWAGVHGDEYGVGAMWEGSIVGDQNPGLSAWT